MLPSKKEISLLIFLILVAIIRFIFFIPNPPNYNSVVGESVVVEGMVSSFPDIRLKNQRLVIRPKGEETNILVIIDRNMKVAYGDNVKVFGTLETPENFITNSEKEFNYEKYLANQDIYFLIKNATLEIISHGNGNYFKSLLFKFRDSFIKNINKVILPPESDLANGLILGARGGFDISTKDEFISTGTIHIIALSGYNVTIVAEWVMRIFGTIFSQVVSIICGIFVIILFIIMSGASSTAVRAGIMAVIMLFGRMTDRTYDAGRALVIAGILMIVYDPRVITDISFQLSFLATFGVLFLTPKVIKWFPFFATRFRIRELIATTVSATISVLPILLYSTGIFSLVSLPANILVLPFIPLTMFFSFLAGFIGFISPFLAMPFAYISHLFLSYILSIIHIFASIPFASVNIKSFPIIVTILMYGILFWWVFFKKEKIKPIKNK